mmetsp:Transcript_132885/g.384209  ORF Transcript_132885/g.384209 Transcript_132885/m.384209 type:complete len:239 (+) Transcript_132885:72-788(+)
MFASNSSAPTESLVVGANFRQNLSSNSARFLTTSSTAECALISPAIERMAAASSSSGSSGTITSGGLRRPTSELLSAWGIAEIRERTRRPITGRERIKRSNSRNSERPKRPSEGRPSISQRMVRRATLVPCKRSAPASNGGFNFLRLLMSSSGASGDGVEVTYRMTSRRNSSQAPETATKPSSDGDLQPCSASLTMSTQSKASMASVMRWPRPILNESRNLPGGPCSGSSSTRRFRGG